MINDDLAQDVLARLEARGLSLAVAESLTGGLILATLTSIPGSSEVVMGGVVSYSNSVKEKVLGVDDGLLRERGPVDRGVVEEMASHVASLCGADIGLATTGVAGPGEHDGVAAGTYWIAVSTPGRCQSQQHRFDGSRGGVRSDAVRSGLNLLLTVIGSDHEDSATSRSSTESRPTWAVARTPPQGG